MSGIYRHIVAAVTTILLSLPCVSTHAANVYARGVFARNSYETLALLSDSVVWRKGLNYLSGDTVYADSALACFTVLTDRQADLSGDIKKHSVYANAAYLNLAYLYQQYYYDYAKAYSYYQRALDNAKTNGLPYDMPYAFIGMAGILDELGIESGSLPKPVNLLKQALDIAIKNKDDHIINHLCINFIELGLDGDDPSIITSTLPLIDKYKPSAQFIEKLFAECVKRLAHAYVSGNYPAMVREADVALGLCDTLSMRETYYLTMLRIKGSALHLAGRDAEVPAVLLKMLQLSRENSYSEYMSYAYRELFRHYQRVGDNPRAREYEYNWLHFTDSLRRVSNLNAVKDVEFLNQLEKASVEMKVLKAQRKTQIAIIAGISIIALIAIAFLVYFIMTRRHIRETNRRLYNQVQQLLASPAGTPAVAPVAPESSDEVSDEDSAPEESRELRLPSERSGELYRKALDVMSATREIFSPDFSIRQLAEIAGEPYYDLSAAINDNGSSFKALLTDFRIKEACRRLSDPATLKEMTMETLAESLGFKSRTYFNSVFKKHTGLTPTQYARIAAEKK